MENIDNWEVVSDEQMGAYLSDKRDSINISGFDDGIDARYSYEVDVEKKDYRNYFGKIQHNYQDLKRNPLSTFSRNAWNGLIDLPRGLGDAIIGAGEYVAFKSVGGIDPEFDKRLAEGANALRAKNAEWFKQWEYVNTQQDNTFVSDLGRAGGSLVSALGLSYVTRNPSIVAGAFGVSQFGNINKELRERGVDIDRSLAISSGLGLAEGVLEKVGLHLWFENAATKKISTYLIKQGATEFTQEASQTAVEEVSMKLLGERDTEWFDIVKDVIYSGVIGGITGIGGGAVSIPSTEAFKKQAKERLVEKGFTEEKAQQLVDDAAYSNEEARRDLIELVNKEADQSTLLNGSYEDDVKAFAEVMQKNVVAEAFDIKQTLKETAMTEGGLDEETAEVASTLVENFTKVMYNETGQTPLEQFEEKGLTIIDERYPSPQDEVIDESELTEEEIARLDAREKEEFDIPFQTDQLRPGDKEYYQGSGNIYKATNSNEEAIANPENFNVFIAGSKVTDNDEEVSPENPPKKLYRGDTVYFEEFSPQENSFEYDYGTGFYLSDNYDDVVTNYQSEGADLTNRIEREAEELSYSEDIDYEEAKARIEEKYKQEDIIREFYVSMKNPVVVGGQKDTWFDFTQEYDEELDEYGEPQGSLIDIIENMKNYLYDIGADDVADAVTSRIMEEAYDGGIFASQLEDIVREMQETSFLLDYGSSEGELLARTYERSGYDGIIDHRAGEKFSKRNMNLDYDTTHYIVFNSEQAKSVDNKGMWSDSPNFYYQFAGEQSQTAALDELDKAKQLERQGVKNEDIRQQTGWFKGADNKWRYEISDDDAQILVSIKDAQKEIDAEDEKIDIKIFKARNQEEKLFDSFLRKEITEEEYQNKKEKINQKVEKLKSGKRKLRLKDILKHDKLYAAYPELADVRVEISKAEWAGDAYFRENTIVVKESVANTDKESKELKGLLLHEIQHAIQTKEGFARGGSVETYKAIKQIVDAGRYSSERDKYEQAALDYNVVLDAVQVVGVSEKPEKLFKTSWWLKNGDVFVPKKSSKYYKQYMSEKAEQYIRETTKKYKDSFLRPEDFERYMALIQMDKKELNDIFRKEGRKLDRLLGKAFDKRVAKYESLVDDIDKGRISGYEVYQRLYGEIEARNTAERMELTEAERLSIAPEKTQDIENSDAIIIFDDGTMASYEIPQKRAIRRGSYNPKTQVIRLFKEANPSTIIHELGHFFTMKYVRALEETGQQEKLAGFYNWLGINSIDEATTETWEKMARGFETYALEGVAPNASTQSVFQRMKQWLIGVYQDLKGKVIPPEEINDDVRAFFDGMLASEQTPVDVSNVKGRTDDLINIINAAMRGEEVAIDGISIKDVNNLIKASNARLPRLPKNLEQVIRAAGGIDIKLAQSLGLYDSMVGNRSGFFKEGGAFDREDSLIEFLRDEGFLSVPEAISYEQTAEIQDRAVNLLENAAEVFRESDIGTIQQRESLIEAAQEASKLLQKIDYKEVQQAINTLNEKSISAVQKDTLKYIKARLNRIDKDYRKIVDNSLRSQRKDIAQKQSDVIAYIREQPISNDHKFRLINEVKKANTEETYEKAINEVKRRADEYYEQEQKKILTTQIKKEIKKSKPVKATQQRYDYETNKLFQSLREYNKLTQDAASLELEKFIGIEEPQNTDLIKIRFLNYKANGMKSSTQLMEQVLDDILQAKRLGSMLKDQADMEAKINKEELKQEVLEAVKASTADKNSFKTQFTNLYRRGFANLYSMINSIASRKLAERFEMETVLNDADVAFYRHTDNLTKKVMNVFGIKSRGELLNKFADMGEVVDTIYAENGNKYDVTKLDIVDIYNAIKNEKTRNNYLTAYGEEQVMRVVNMLNQQERLFADVMMDDINSLYPETNKIYIEAYGMDLKKVENYWPATSEHIKETDLLGDFYVQQETPSFYKERVKGHVIPMPKNAWEKYLKHVNESLYMIKVARKYKELSDTFKSSRVRNQIENKYGKGVYNELMKQINDLSLNAKSESLNYVESAFGSVLNNFVVAKIAIAPTVFAGQLTSITNYSEEVNTADFYKNFAEGLGHPKETIKFMKKYAGDFLETRYRGGYSEALNRVQREAEQANKRKFKILSDKTKYNVTNALTSFVRVGDMGSLIFGGYAQIQTNIKAGMSLDDAVKKFEFDTLRSQQSSNAASLSSFQKSRGFSRVLLAFKNTQHQYLRKLVDSVIQYQRGEISSTQCAKTILNYAVIQGSLYIIAKNAVKAAMGLGDDDDEITDGLLEQLVVGNLDAIPFVSDIARYAYKKAAGEYTHGLLNMPGLDDIERAIMKLYKENKDVYDWVDIIAPLIEGTTATPVKRYAGIIKKYMEDE